MSLAWWWLDRELARWEAAGYRPRLWWRDDDARMPTPALARLAALAENCRLPLVLAVIPGEGPIGGLQRLGRFLADRPGVFTAQHGVTHANAYPSGMQAAEFPASMPAEAMIPRLRAGRDRLEALPGALPLFVPPWNAVPPALPQALREAGIGWLSAAAELPGAGLRQAHVQLDPLRWKPVPHFRGEGACLWRLARLLRRRRRTGAWASPVGLLTHHLDHDEAGWAFLEAALPRLAGDTRIAWPQPEAVFQ